MPSDRKIQEAIEAGEKNVDDFLLVKNWCAHVRIERFGGVGLVEQMTGLPIGHHGLTCDHAPPGGSMSWDIRDAAVEFYDRNCRDCSLREPVGVPNLGSWVKERDEEEAKRQASAEAEALEVAAKLRQRQVERASLRAVLRPVAANVIDQIEELDNHRGSDRVASLIETARLAPEAFPPEVIEYVFGLLEDNDYWFDEAGLQVLFTLGADPPRLTRCAMACLQRWSNTRTAATILLAHLLVADEALIPSALPAIIRMASPERGPFSSPQRARIAPLTRVYEAFPDRVTAALNALLDQQPADVGLAACAIKVLAPVDSKWAARFARDLISKLVRAYWMPDPDELEDTETSGVAIDLLDAVVAIFMCDPNNVDGLLQSFRVGATEAGELRIFSVYRRILDSIGFRQSRSINDGHRIAFRRLLRDTPAASSDRVLREVQGLFTYQPEDLIGIAQEEIDSLLGAAIRMDERIATFDAEPIAEDATVLDLMDRSNQRATLFGLRGGFVSWAAKAAAAAGNPASYLEILEGLPEDRDEFASCMIENSVSLIDTASGLNATLPTLYSALMCSSVLRRGSAATVLGQMNWRQQENAPDLLFEAFSTLLIDPYVYVHTSAVAALRRMTLPERFDNRIRTALWNILLVHEKDADRNQIALDCVKLLADRYLTVDERRGRAGGYLVTVLKKMPGWHVSNDIEFLARRIAEADGLVDLLVTFLSDPEATKYSDTNFLSALVSLPDTVIYENRDKLLEIPLGNDPSSRRRTLFIVQTLTRSHAWSEAEQLSKLAVANIPDTVREAYWRMTFQLTEHSIAFERALAADNHSDATKSARNWRDIKAALEANERERTRRPDPSDYLRGPT